MILYFLIICKQGKSLLRKTVYTAQDLLQGGNWECTGVTLDDAYNNSENTKSRGENLNNEDLHKKRSILSITDGTTGSRNTH
mmetsp:Transcript_20026/g.29050  ORF Transcript_20026/g.29050 Transcript_20026/m.29050 type:complete len:82 (-) Transcript_20026:467-712(-)